MKIKTYFWCFGGKRAVKGWVNSCTVDVTTDQVVTEDGAGTLPPHFSKRAAFIKVKLLKRVLAVGAILVLAYVGFRFLPDFLALKKAGFLENAEIQKTNYSASREENLKALHAALMRLHDSEDRFPTDKNWILPLKPFLDTGDLVDGEWSKKLRNPLLGPGSEWGGYVLNQAVLGKHKLDLAKGGKTVLLVEDKSAQGEVVGSATAKPGMMSILVDGTIIKN